MLKIWRSPQTTFGKYSRELDVGKDETMTAVAVYTDAELASISQAGFNAIWVHGLLRNMVRSSVFPEFGSRAELHQDAMRKLIQRAAGHGIKVFIYMQPPRAVTADIDFWEQHADAGGCVEMWRGPKSSPVAMRSLCTSTDKVRRFLRESSEALIRALPGLGGLILITASEYPSHCWARRGSAIDHKGHLSAFRKTDCPRCVERSPGAIVAEIVGLIRDGVKQGDPKAEVIAWNWSWSAYEVDPSPEIIRSLPKDVILMADFERGGNKVILGKKRVIDEYSLSYTGPSERFSGARECALEAGMRVMAKVQIGTTHELATVPNLPLIKNLIAKAQYCRSHDLAGFVGCWNFGNQISANTASFNYGLSPETPESLREAMEAFARTYFPGCDATRVADAWEAFGRAMDQYPFSIPFLYSSPINYALVHPLRAAPSDGVACGGSWRVEEGRGDCLEASLDPYTLDEVIEGFARVQAEWKNGVEALEVGLSRSESVHAKEELDTARVCGHVFRSTYNLYRCWKLRREWIPAYESDFLPLAKDEVAHLQEIMPILERDSRQGFHGEAFVHMFNPELVKDKIRDLEAEIVRLQSTSARHTS